MPLIIITGLPTSGKSTRAAQLHAYFAARIAGTGTGTGTGITSGPGDDNPKPKTKAKAQYRLHLISDETLRIPRTVYDLSAAPDAHARSANAAEKDARAAVYAAVKRVLSPRDIVILDGLNYIKGWRYQLFCEAKNARTPCAVLQVGCLPERARAVNEARLQRRERAHGPEDVGGKPSPGGGGGGGSVGGVPGEERGNTEVALASSFAGDDHVAGAAAAHAEETSAGGTKTSGEESADAAEPYSPSNWENLAFRYEEPNPMTRWDSPLFTLVWEDDEARAHAVFDAIWSAVAGDEAARTPVKPNMSTVQRDRDLGGDYLYLLERETQDIVKTLLDRQQQSGDDGGVEVRIPRGGDGEDLLLELPGRKLGLPQLQRYRRTFVSLNRGGIGVEAGKLAVGRLREAFVLYLSDAFEKDE